jgi:3',5'-cyclic AMP phosphodiesterase CpdA
MPGAQGRLNAFLVAAQNRSLDFLIQLGDFCDGYSSDLTPEQKKFLKAWHQFPAVKYNVLGNHEMDRGSKAQIMERLEMLRNYYSFDVKGFHFVTLDCMHVRENGKIVDYVSGNYFQHSAEDINLVDPQQLNWLARDLKATSLPTIVFTHPCINAFWYAGAELTRANVREVLTKVNEQAGWQKVIACFSGHHHVDHYSQFGGVNYLLVNSASYFWVGAAYGSLAKYRDPLFTFVTISADGSLTIEGKDSVFVPPTPIDLHFPEASRLTASIRTRDIQFRAKTPHISEERQSGSRFVSLSGMDLFDYHYSSVSNSVKASVFDGAA